VATEAYVQVPPDSTGRRVANFAVTLPGGTAVTDAAGTQTFLAADTTVFVQKVTLVDRAGADVDLTDSTAHELLYRILQCQLAIAEGVSSLARGAGK
jgi:hypothetical protein